MSHRRSIDFDRINGEALVYLDATCRGLLPDGSREGQEYLAINPRRGDRLPARSRLVCTPGSGPTSRSATRAPTFPISGSITNSTTILARRTAPRAAPGPRLVFEATLPHSIPPTPDVTSKPRRANRGEGRGTAADS
jgi:hypothetical protein